MMKQQLSEEDQHANEPRSAFWETSQDQYFSPDRFQSYLRGLNSPLCGQVNSAEHYLPNEAEPVDYSKVSLSQYSRQILQSQLQNRRLE